MEGAGAAGAGGTPEQPEFGLPDLVHVPIQSADRDADETVVELRVLPDGTTAVPVYTDRDRLVAGCGDAQPWMLIPVDRLIELRDELGFDQLMVDVALPLGEQRRQAGSDDVGR